MFSRAGSFSGIIGAEIVVSAGVGEGTGAGRDAREIGAEGASRPSRNLYCYWSSLHGFSLARTESVNLPPGGDSHPLLRSYPRSDPLLKRLTDPSLAQFFHSSACPNTNTLGVREDSSRSRCKNGILVGPGVSYGL